MHFVSFWSNCKVCSNHKISIFTLIKCLFRKKYDSNDHFLTCHAKVQIDALIKIYGSLWLLWSRLARLTDISDIKLLAKRSSERVRHGGCNLFAWLILIMTLIPFNARQLHRIVLWSCCLSPCSITDIIWKFPRNFWTFKFWKIFQNF